MINLDVELEMLTLSVDAVGIICAEPTVLDEEYAKKIINVGEAIEKMEKLVPELTDDRKQHWRDQIGRIKEKYIKLSERAKNESH